MAAHLQDKWIIGKTVAAVHWSQHQDCNGDPCRKIDRIEFTDGSCAVFWAHEAEDIDPYPVAGYWPPDKPKKPKKPDS